MVRDELLHRDQEQQRSVHPRVRALLSMLRNGGVDDETSACATIREHSAPNVPRSRRTEWSERSYLKYLARGRFCV
jgi:hypothetical protein